MSKVNELNTLHPLDCLFVAQVRSEWAQATWFYDRGYIRYDDGTKQMLREHQYVAQLAYGLSPFDGLHIHHIDGNKFNNRADNLQVMTNSEHSRIHNPQQRIILTCLVCNQPFETNWFRFTKRSPGYCSLACRNLAQRKVKRPPAGDLCDLMIGVNNWTVLGRMFGVSDSAIRKWARGYSLDLSVCDGRRRR